MFSSRSVGLSVIRITQKVIDERLWKFLEVLEQETINNSMDKDSEIYFNFLTF